jgi:hypothetical protein
MSLWPRPIGAFMFAQQISGAIEGARTLTRMDALARLLWQGHAAGAVADDEAQRLAELLHAKKAVVRAAHEPVGLPQGRPSIFPPRRPQRAPRRPEAIARRRRLASSGPLPPALACRFTVGQLATLRIIGDEVRHHGRCDRTLAEIAARAGVCRSIVQAAVREAARLGLVTVEERRRQGQVNLPNVVRILSREWTAWLTRGPKGAATIGFKKSDPTDTRQGKRLSEVGSASSGPGESTCRGTAIASDRHSYRSQSNGT